MQMHHHASLPEAVQPALLQQSSQSRTAHSPSSTTAAYGNHTNEAVNQIPNKNTVKIKTPINTVCSAAAIEWA